MLDDAVRTDLPADLTGPAVARRFVTQHAGHLSEELVRDAQLLVSELVTNALRYGQPPFAVAVRAEGDGLDVAVDDHGPGLPKITDPPPGPGEPSGRGLHIVASVAQDWGVIRRSPGKRVWFRVG